MYGENGNFGGTHEVEEPISSHNQFPDVTIAIIGNLTTGLRKARQPYGSLGQLVRYPIRSLPRKTTQVVIDGL